MPGPRMDVEKAIKLAGRAPVNPVGKCFDTAAFQMVFAPGGCPDNARLCHGVGVTNAPGQEGLTMAHAWIELDTRQGRGAFDTTWGVMVDAAKYRRELQLDYVVEYTKDEALAHWTRTDRPGPWDQRVAAACSD